MLVGGYREDTAESDVVEWLETANRKTGLCNEPRRIAYVAMTRPRKLLIVAIPRECGPAVLAHNDWRQGGFEHLNYEELCADELRQ